MSRMDARQRLNHLRRFNRSKISNKFNRNKVKRNGHQLNDLRQLIDNKIPNFNNNNNNNNRNSVKNRIGFKTKNNNQQKIRQLMGRNRGRNDRQTNKRVSLSEDQRLPTVVVDFSRMDRMDETPTNPIITSTATQSMYSSRVEQRINNPTNESKKSVLVSNLNKSITDNDVKELFGDIGPIVRSSKLNNSVALVVYHNEMDARKACQTYHNRLLDGLPMECNTLSLSNDDYSPIEAQPKDPNMSYSRQSSKLLASQLKQINSLYPKPISGQTFTRKRSNNRYVVDV